METKPSAPGLLCSWTRPVKEPNRPSAFAKGQRIDAQKGQNWPPKKKVSGFKCTEGKRSANGVIGKDATEFDARVTCTRGGTQRIVHTYQQTLDLEGGARTIGPGPSRPT